MRRIDKIYIHCADTPEGAWFDSSDIRQWHVDENGWKDIGYHYIVTLDGKIELGRPVQNAGAGVKGDNRHSIHICYIGGYGGDDTRTPEQKTTIENLIMTIRSLLKEEVPVLGHRDNNPKKYCPSYDAKKEHN